MVRFDRNRVQRRPRREEVREEKGEPTTMKMDRRLTEMALLKTPLNVKIFVKQD